MARNSGFRFDDRGVLSERDRGKPYPACGGETAYVDFTAATGAGSAVQDILDWTFTGPSTIPGQVVDMDDAFYNASSLILNGGGSVSQGALLISAPSPSNASSAYFVRQATTNRFAIDFDFNVGSGNGQGFTFVIQSQVRTRSVRQGGGLGYGPPLPKCLHLANCQQCRGQVRPPEQRWRRRRFNRGLSKRGVSPSACDRSKSGINLHSGHTFHARLTYDGTNLTEVITDLTQYAVFTKSFPVDFPAAVGNANAHVGFTSGTATASADPVKILNWSLTSTF
jgi:hypothetical protein